jgi:hypothetical protein
MLFILLLLFNPWDVSGSPVFPIQQNFDSNNNNDWNLVSTYGNENIVYEIAKNVTECQINDIGSIMKYPLPGIDSVSYISDGKQLNTTLWLSDPIEDPSIKKIINYFQTPDLTVNVIYTNNSLINYTNQIISNIQFLYGNPIIYNTTSSWLDVNVSGIDYSISSGEKVSKSVFKKDNRVFIITYRAPIELFNDYLIAINRISQSIINSTLIDNNNSSQKNDKLYSNNSSNDKKNDPVIMWFDDTKDQQIDLADSRIIGINNLNFTNKNDIVEYIENNSHIGDQQILTLVDGDNLQKVNATLTLKNKFDKYIDTKDGYEVHYPNDWKINDEHSFFIIEAPLYKNYTINTISQSYFILLDPITSNEGYAPDYMIELFWNSSSNQWTKNLKQFSPTGREEHILSSEPLNNTSLKYGQKFITIDFDLSYINSPQQYALIFGIQHEFLKGNFLCFIQDGTNAFILPPPEFTFEFVPSSVRLKPGQEITLELKTNAKSPFTSSAYFYNLNKVNGINLDINPSKTDIPTNGMSSSMIKVKALDNAIVNPYTFIVRSEFYSNTTLAETSSGKPIYGVPQHLLAIKDLSLPVTIDEPLTIFDYFNSALNTWGTGIRNFFEIITVIGGAGISGLIINMIKKKKENQNKNKVNVNNSQKKRSPL